MRAMMALVLHLGGVGECMRLIWGWSDHGQELGDLHIHCEPSIASRPSLHRRAVHREPSIASRPFFPSPGRPSRLVHCSIAKPSIAPLPTRPLRAIHRELSIAPLPSRPSQAIHCEPSIASRPLRHRRAGYCNIAEPSPSRSSLHC